MAGTRSTRWGYALAASTFLLAAGAAALIRAGTAADEGRLIDGALPLLWLVFGTGLVSATVCFPAYLGYLNNERNRSRRQVPPDGP